jgi:hypothetical protein
MVARAIAAGIDGVGRPHLLRQHPGDAGPSGHDASVAAGHDAGATSSPDAGAPAASAALPSCCGGLVTFGETTIGQIPRPSFVHDLAWVRSHAGLQEPDIVAFTSYHIHYQPQPQPRGGWRITAALTFPHMWVAREYEHHPRLDRIVQHERGHIPGWTRIARASMDALRTDLASRWPGIGPVTAGMVGAAARAETDATLLALRQDTNSWDATDYPALHAALQSATGGGVPPAQPSTTSAGHH